jgi:acetyl esterase
MASTHLAALAVVSLTALFGVSVARPHCALAQEKGKDTLQRADKNMQLVLKKLEELGAKPLGTQSVEETRKGPTPGDAANAVLKDQGKNLQAIMAQMKVSKQDLSYPTAGGAQPIRIYTPEAKPPAGGWPVIVYYHGGGWVIATIDTYEASAMALANKTKAIVASAEYRHAPEYKFPAAHEDAFLAYQWVLSNAGTWNGNPERVAVAGESAGGNLALNTAIMARDRNVQPPRHMLLVYPVAGTKFDTPSYRENADAMPLSKPAMQWFFTQATSGPQDLQDPRLDLIGHAKLDNLPSATVITAEIDPLRSEGKELADKLKAAGSKVTYKDYGGVTHEFFGMAALVKDADRAQELAASDLKKALASMPTRSTNNAKKKS